VVEDIIHGGIPVDKAKEICDYYKVLLGLTLWIFTGVAVGVAWGVSGTVSDLAKLSPVVGNYLPGYLLFHDIYGTAWLLIGVGGLLVISWSDTVRHVASPRRPKKKDDSEDDQTAGIPQPSL
jgi:hypothetical protein